MIFFQYFKFKALLLICLILVFRVFRVLFCASNSLARELKSLTSLKITLYLFHCLAREGDLKDLDRNTQRAALNVIYSKISFNKT